MTDLHLAGRIGRLVGLPSLVASVVLVGILRGWPPTLALPLALGLATAGFWTWSGWGASAWGMALLYGATFTSAWALGLARHTSPTSVTFLLPTLILLAILTAQSAYVASGRSPWLVAAVLVGVALAVFTGPEGGPGRFVRFLLEVVRLTPDQAALVNLVARKSIHVGGFGLLAYCGARGGLAVGAPVARALPLGLAWGLPHAVFDELNQSFVPNRSGSPWDIGLDAVGMVLALTLLTRQLGTTWQHAEWPWTR